MQHKDLLSYQRRYFNNGKDPSMMSFIGYINMPG